MLNGSFVLLRFSRNNNFEFTCIIYTTDSQITWLEAKIRNEHFPPAEDNTIQVCIVPEATTVYIKKGRLSETIPLLANNKMKYFCALLNLTLYGYAKSAAVPFLARYKHYIS